MYPLYCNLMPGDCFVQAHLTRVVLCLCFVETTTLADTATPTLPADIETSTVPVTTPGETGQQSVLHESNGNAGLMVLLGRCNDESL